MSQSQVAQRIRAEIFSWTSLAFVMALLEGGVIGVVIKNGFAGQVDDWLLNLCVAIATGAPFYSNLISFIWVKLSAGKSKAQIVSNLSIVCCFCGLGISFVSFTSSGLVVLVLLLVVARVCWSGIMTIRSNIWRVNYPRYIRGKVTAKLATMASLLMSVAAFAAGWTLDWRFEAFQWLYISFALFSLFGAYRYRFLSVRHYHKHLEQERDSTQKASFSRIFRVLQDNRAFAKYMLSMFILGSGNLMFMAPLIVYLNEYTGLNKSEQILITTAIPLALVPFAVGWWARLLDGNHIFHFRSIHSWGFATAIFTFVLAQITVTEWLFFVGAFIYGVAISGGVIGWNLGHNDFVSNASPMDYMAVHVTLTGLRGLFAPLLGIGFYQWLETIQPGNGRYALLLPFSITTIGGILFVYFNRQRLSGQLE
ncbi:MFS transporter [Aliikangiella marina]|uniref:MFS transporter n=1 Tax=Aliikangiella marina TaxID=1712262 RepID=A0A545TIB7_9GAMM|nr:MFS transporter [Aliikangiella marina]TQV76965.1 MFS transporter [Aliikangiella marina]